MDSSEAVVADTKQYIVVKIDNEQYGIDIGYVDNIVRMQRITRVPKAQDYFEGVINLRGEVIPVMSMRKKFCLDDDVITGKTRIIILKTDQQALIGVQVDEVKEVVTLSESEVDKITYDKKQEDNNTYLSGIGKHDGELISLLDINAVISEEE
ncbi:MAG: purine-binding chemotaxis protein CheW [Lachnospira sp.]|nr:purine-binding chemotaxis protein CheW [Lachnospira sp.]